MIENFFVVDDAKINLASLLEYQHRSSLMQDFVEKVLNSPIMSVASLPENSAAFTRVDGRLSLVLSLDQKVTLLYFDFLEGEVATRLNKVSKSNEVLAKALGFKPHYRPRVLDATAGMGRDAMIMAALGCEVEMQERNPSIYLLLADALSRFTASPLKLEIPGSLKLAHQDSLTRLNNNNDATFAKSYDAIYLDPMFPERKKSALVKKEMRLFKMLAGNDNDCDELMQSAMQSGVKRIVVKRPKGAPLLAGLKPSHEIKAKKFRFDIYLK